MNRYFSWLFVLVVLLGCSCHFARTDFILETLNKPADTAAPGEAPTVTVTERVARLTREHLADSYFAPTEVAVWMSELGRAPELLIELVGCLARGVSVDPNKCYDEDFRAKAVLAPQWGVPRAPSSVNPLNPNTTEIDAARFLANTMSIAPSLVALQHALGRPIAQEELARGIQEGAEAAARYVDAREWQRVLKRPTNAIVMSGGSANGAFSAGAIWRLLGILEQCRGTDAPVGCADARIDLVVGASTGTLVGTLVDLFHTKDQEQHARELLVSNYTCSVESDLYCVNSAWDWELAEDLRGLVRFDRLQDKLEAAVIPKMLSNDTELVAVSVDYASGDVYGISDQDPADFSPAASEQERVEGFIQAIMASIVEPVLSEPIDWVPSSSGRKQGTFVDGGVRSGLPLLQAMQRGAERVLVISTSGIEPVRVPNPPHAFGMLIRTIDLFVHQPRVGEVQQAEMAAVVRRLTEYNICEARLLMQDPKERPSKGDVVNFCKRSGDGFIASSETRPEAAVSMWMGPARLEQVATSWRSSWMYLPETGLETASGYAFTPTVMRPLFLQGVRTFQTRCRELLELFEIRGDLANAECSRPVEEVEKEAEAAFAPLAQCVAHKPESRKCR